MTDEQSVGDKAVDRARSGAIGLGGTNDRADREPTIEEDCRLGHDQVGLGQFAVGVEVGEDQTVRGIGQGRRIAGFILPRLEVHNLGAADAEQNSQHLVVGDPLGERGVYAGASLLDPREVEAGRVGDRLQVVRRSEVAIVSRNRRKLPSSQAWDGLREGVAEVGVQRVAAVARPETGVDGQLHQVGEPVPDQSLNSGGSATHQGAKLIQIDGFGAFRGQIRIKEPCVGNLIVGVIMDVLRHVPIEDLNGGGIGRIPGSSGNFGVLDSAEFVVLLPQVGFDEFRCRQQPKNSLVSRCKTATRSCGGGIGQQSRADGSRSHGERFA